MIKNLGHPLEEIPRTKDRNLSNTIGLRYILLSYMTVVIRKFSML